MTNKESKARRSRSKVKNREILELKRGGTLGSSEHRWWKSGRSRSLGEWRSAGMRGEESAATPSRFIGEEVARLPSDDECRSSAIAMSS